MARLSIDRDAVVLHLNWLEKFADLSLRDVRAPLTSVLRVDVGTPYPSLVPDEVDLGLVSNTAPLAPIFALKTRAKAIGGGRAAVAVYLNRPAVIVHCDRDSRWRLLVVSVKQPADTVTSIRVAAGL